MEVFFICPLFLSSFNPLKPKRPKFDDFNVYVICPFGAKGPL